MTIAACYLSREGVVLGADSTGTFDFGVSESDKGAHYLNYAQKLFEIGNGSTLGIVSWGFSAGAGDLSYRTMTACLADSFAAKSPHSVVDVANLWIDMFWAKFSTVFATDIARAQELIWKGDAVTDEEKEELIKLQGLVVGFCLGGYWPDEQREPCAYEIIFDPRTPRPNPKPIVRYRPSFWGVPGMMDRLLQGVDTDLLIKILQSDKWSGTAKDLLAIQQAYRLAPPNLPLREAIDFVHASIYSTIKALKFSRRDQVCGGPIEVAVISSDRFFRWVRHKEMDAAIKEQEGRIWRTREGT